MTNTSLIEFPCDFPVKIIGTHSKVFLDEISQIARKHFPAITDQAITQQPSKNSNYLALTITVHALNQAMLDNFYKDITSHPDVKMVL